MASLPSSACQQLHPTPRTHAAPLCILPDLTGHAGTGKQGWLPSDLQACVVGVQPGKGSLGITRRNSSPMFWWVCRPSLPQMLCGSLCWGPCFVVPGLKARGDPGVPPAPVPTSLLSTASQPGGLSLLPTGHQPAACSLRAHGRQPSGAGWAGTVLAAPDTSLQGLTPPLGGDPRVTPGPPPSLHGSP